jgi:signal transduction histidine kinase
VTARPGPWRLYWRAGVVAAFTVCVAVGVLVEERERADIEDQRDAREVALRAALPVVTAIGSQLENAVGAGAGVRQVGVGDVDGPSDPAAALARDTGRPALDDVHGGVVVTALFDPPEPTSVAARRAGLIGFSLTPLVLGPTLDSVGGDRGSLVVTGPTREVASAGTVPDEGPGFELGLDEAGAPGWTLEATVPRTPLPPGAWLVSLAVLLGGLAVALTMVRQSRRNLAERQDGLRRRRSESTLTELAGVAQHSLDLAEVLPATFAVLESSLDLDGVALLSTNGRPTFAWRDAPTDDEPSLPFEAPAPAGCCLNVPLSRGGRSLGVLRVRPGRDLDELDLRTLAGVAETLSSAIANAEAYAHQRAMINRMRGLDDLKTVFVATASHELRTPVAAVIGYASMLVENWEELDPETGLLYARRVDSNARRLADLVDHLLDFSRLEQGGSYRGEKVLIDLGDEVSVLVEGLRDLIQDHDLQLRADPGLVVLGSKLAVERVLTNLVGNAAKYSPAGSTVRVRVEGDDDTVRLIVDDEGPGVPEQEREQVFSRFYRGRGDAVVRTRGAGLGLSIVTEFVSSMDGEVSTCVAPTGGARFAVTYPRHPAGTVPHVSDLGDADDPA